MTALTAAKMPLSSQTIGTTANQLSASVDCISSGLDADPRALLSIFGRTLYLLGFGTIGVVAITGQPPLFFIPLALFLFFGSCLQWRQPSRVRARAEERQLETVAASSVRREPFAVYDDKS
jgi:hypothetical protein